MQFEEALSRSPNDSSRSYVDFANNSLHYEPSINESTKINRTIVPRDKRVAKRKKEKKKKKKRSRITMSLLKVDQSRNDTLRRVR